MAFEANPSAADATSALDAVLFDAAVEAVRVLHFQLLKTNAAGRFEWSDGFLVDALQVCLWSHFSNILVFWQHFSCDVCPQLGHWVMFDNVNFCSPSVRSN